MKEIRAQYLLRFFAIGHSGEVLKILPLPEMLREFPHEQNAFSKDCAREKERIVPGPDRCGRIVLFVLYEGHLYEPQGVDGPAQSHHTPEALFSFQPVK